LEDKLQPISALDHGPEAGHIIRAGVYPIRRAITAKPCGHGQDLKPVKVALMIWINSFVRSER
jgi:hypothetical protein